MGMYKNIEEAYSVRSKADIHDSVKIPLFVLVKTRKMRERLNKKW